MPQKYYMRRLADYLGCLSRNNNREWFRANRAEFDELRAAFIADLDRLAVLMGEVDPDVAGFTGRDSVYRIYRDTRFSPDKTPYKTFFSASFTQGGRNALRAGYYLHVDPARCDSGVFAGIWQPPAPMLRKLRKAIIDNIDEWEQIIADADATGARPWSSTELKTVPRGYPKDHPQARWLRMLDYGLYRPMSRAAMLDPSWPEAVAAACAPLRPFNRFINYSLDE